MASRFILNLEETYMHRCLQLAQIGQSQVAPNPMVGAVLVHEGQIIGEGFHKKYGDVHAEVNCVRSVAEKDVANIEHATLYVSLEPCAHQGKTPPCADFILSKGIPRVVIGTRDPFVRVAGKGIEKLRKGGVEVIDGVLNIQCRELNKRFLTFHEKQRPYVVLKWAQSADGKVAKGDYRPARISNDHTNRIVHKWRSEEMAILIGTNTALFDNPRLTTRLWPGKSPLRLVVDLNLRLPAFLKLFDGTEPTIVFNKLRNEEHRNLRYHKLTGDQSLVQQILGALREWNIHSVLVEGGVQLLQSFIDEGTWDEARVISNEKFCIPDGLSAPLLKKAKFVQSEMILSDTIRTYLNQHC